MVRGLEVVSLKEWIKVVFYLGWMPMTVLAGLFIWLTICDFTVN